MSSILAQIAICARAGRSPVTTRRHAGPAFPVAESNFIEDGRLSPRQRREQTTSLDLAQLRRIADQHQLGLSRLGVVDQADQGRRVHRPGPPRRPLDRKALRA